MEVVSIEPGRILKFRGEFKRFRHGYRNGIRLRRIALCFFEQLFYTPGTLLEVPSTLRARPSNCQTQLPDIFAPPCSEIFQQLNEAILLPILLHRQSVRGQHIHVSYFAGSLPQGTQFARETLDSAVGIEPQRQECSFEASSARSQIMHSIRTGPLGISSQEFGNPSRRFVNSFNIE